jgi:predicted RNA-binding Zn ribbon-like protein
MTGDFLFLGERLCLDFVNTELVRSGTRVDLLSGFSDLAGWCAAAGVLAAGQSREMTARWGATPGAARTFDHARRFRRTLRALAERLASGRSVPPAVLDAINDVLRGRVGDLAVVRTQAGYETLFLARWAGPEQLLVPVAESAAALLCQSDVSLVKKCENPACILFFYDTTRNHGRRWCSMTACGNRAKVAAHYRRTKRASTRTRP